MMCGGDTIGDKMAGEIFVREKKIIRSRFVEITKNNTGSVERRREKRQEEEAECDQKFLKKNALSKLPSCP